MINDKCDAVFNAEKRCGQCAGFDHFLVERLVYPPPDVFQYFRKISRVGGGRRHAAGQGRIDVVVPAAERLRYQALMTIQHRIFGFQAAGHRHFIHSFNARVRTRLNGQVGWVERQCLPVDISCIFQVKRHAGLPFIPAGRPGAFPVLRRNFFFIGSSKRRILSNWKSALAVAAAVGIFPISPTPLAP